MAQARVAILFLTLIILVGIIPVCVKGDLYITEGDLLVKLAYQSPPVNDWQTPQKYNVTLQVMKNGTVPIIDNNTTDSYIPDGNVTFTINLETVAQSSIVGTWVVNGSLMDISWDLFGNIMPLNGSLSQYTIALPQDNLWHDVANITCYYNPPPSLPFPREELTEVALDFNIDIWEEMIDNTPPADNSTSEVGWNLIVTYFGPHIGHSYTHIPIYQLALPNPTPIVTPQPTVTPTPTMSSTQTPTIAPTATPTTNPTQNPTTNPTPLPIQTITLSPAPTPTAPEFPAIVIVPISMAVLSIAIVFRKRTLQIAT